MPTTAVLASEVRVVPGMQSVQRLRIGRVELLRVLAFALCNATFSGWYSQDLPSLTTQIDRLCHVPLMFFLFIGAFLWRRESGMGTRWRVACLVASAMASIGVLLPLTAGEGAGGAIVGLSVLFSALGMTVLALLLGTALAELDGRQLVFEIMLGYLLVVTLRAAFLSFASPLMIVLKSLFPLIGGYFLYRALRAGPDESPREFEAPKAPALRTVARFAVAINMIGMTLSIVYTLDSINGGMGFVNVSQLQIPLDFTMIVSGLLVMFLFLAVRFATAYVYRITAIISIVGFLVLPIFGTQNGISFLVNSAAYIGVSAVTWILCVRLSHSLRISPFATVGIGIGSFMGLQTSPIMYLITQALSKYESSSLFLNIVDLFGVALTLMAYLFLFSEKDIFKLDVREKSMPPSAAGPALLYSPGLQAAFGRAHGITPREMEVLVLLGKGRSGSYVQRELRISRGTFNSHSTNLYHKLGVHSREQLMDLIEKEQGMPLTEP